MREIKFRAWDGVLKEYGPDGFFTGFSIFGEVLTFDMIGMRISETMDKRPHLKGVNLLGTNDFILEQFTGLKDKNGKEIYEGDIVACPFSWTGSHREKYHEPKIYNKPVVFTAGDPLCGNQDPRFAPMTWGKWWPDQNYRGIPYLADCWVIGNIHEHEELLK